MEPASWLTMTNGLLLSAGIVIGVLAGHFLSPALRESKRLRSELETLQGEHDKYKASVNSHFRKTADLVGQMTKSYAAVYDHLAGGARRFCDDAGADSQLPFGPSPGQLASPVIDAEADSPVEPAAEPAADSAADEPAIETAEASGELDEPSTSSAEATSDAGDYGDYAAADSADAGVDQDVDADVDADADENYPRTPTA